MENITDTSISVEVTHRSRISVLERLTAYLEHSVSCHTVFCFRMSCLRMKWLMSHVSRCEGRKNLTCRRCKMFVGLCCYHAGTCTNKGCKIPYCNGDVKNGEEEDANQTGDTESEGINLKEYEPEDKHE